MNEIANARALPRQLDCDGEAVTLRLMEAGDGPAVLAFAGALPAHDLLFLRRDICHPKVVEAWIGGMIAPVSASSNPSAPAARVSGRSPG